MSLAEPSRVEGRSDQDPVEIHATGSHRGATPLRVLYLSRVRMNPYVRLLADGVGRADSGLVTKIAPTLGWRSILSLRPADVVHLHWIELQYAYGYPNRWQALWAWRTLRLKLSLLRRRKMALVYTVHNLGHHEELFPDMDQAANTWLFANADAIHVHDRASADAVLERYGRQKDTFVIPHGNYLRAYPNNGLDRTSAAARVSRCLKTTSFICVWVRYAPTRDLND